MKKDDKDLDFTHKEDCDLRCPFAGKKCRLVRVALGFSVSLCILLTILLTYGLGRTVKLFLSLT